MGSPNLRRQLFTIFGTVLVFIAIAAMQGIIGSKAYELFPTVVMFLSEYIEVKDLFYIVLLFLSLLLPSWFLVQYRIALRNATSLNKIDASLIRAIAILYQSSDDKMEEIAKKITKRLLKKVLDVNAFKACGVAIYSSTSSREYLNTWICISEPNEPDPSLSFYVGETNAPGNPSGGRGVAGTTFIDSKSRVVRFDEQGSAENCDVYFPWHGSGKVLAWGYKCTSQQLLLVRQTLNSLPFSVAGHILLLQKYLGTIVAHILS